MRKKEGAALLSLWLLLWLLPALLSGCVATTQPKAAHTLSAVPTAAPVNAAKLIGLRKAEVHKRLGTPQLIRRDGPAEVWQYAADACILDLFLYEDGASHRVDYLELRIQPGATFPRERCFERILTAKNTASLS